MQQDRSPQNRRGSSGQKRRAYDQARDQRRSPSQSRQNSGSSDSPIEPLNFERRHSTGYPDNSIQFPAQRPANGKGRSSSSRPAQRPANGSSRSGQRRNNTTRYPGNGASRNARNGQNQNRQRSGQQARPARNGRLRPTQATMRDPARRERKKKRKMTKAAIRRQRMIRKLTALALVVCVIGVGVYLTGTMLFKISSIQVHNADGSTVQELAGYSSDQILNALGVQLEENIFTVNAAQKAAELEKVFPKLENIRVEKDYPGTLVVRAGEATPAFAMETDGGWLTLSAGLKILEKTSEQPGLPTLYGGEPVSETPGDQLEFELETPAASADASGSAASETEPEQDRRLESLSTLMTALDNYGLLADVTRIEFEDVEEMAFLYQDRISVLLGTLNELDYKLKLGQYVLQNQDGKGCADTDTGVLDLSHLSASSTRKFRFAQGEPELPSGYIVPETGAEPAEGETPADSEAQAESTAEDDAPAETPTEPLEQDAAQPEAAPTGAQTTQ